MRYIVTEQRDNDRFVIYDTENKGSACVSKYTLRQLLEDDTTLIIGITYSFKSVGSKEVVIKDIIPHTKDGKTAQKVLRNEFVPDTKRSYGTVIKGLYPSRAEKKAISDKAKKTKQTKKINKKAKKEAEEIALKEQKIADKKAKEEAEKMRIIRKRIQKSKPQLYLQETNMTATEYDSVVNYKFNVELRSLAALSVLNKLIKSSTAYANTENAGAVIRSGRVFTTHLRCDDRCFIFDDPDLQVFADKKIYYEFDGYDGRCEICFEEYNSYTPNITYTHGTSFSESSPIGPAAYSETSPNAEAKFYRKTLGRPA